MAIVCSLDCNFGSKYGDSKSRRQREMNSSVSDLRLKTQKKQLVAVGTRNKKQIALSLAKRAHLCGLFCVFGNNQEHSFCFVSICFSDLQSAFNKTRKILSICSTGFQKTFYFIKPKKPLKLNHIGF